eukprot:m.13634 g.13634  ORF g.13634 m.13634 type:complete len:725 (+) comp25137_c0_seq1:1251-3425(+)
MSMGCRALWLYFFAFLAGLVAAKEGEDLKLLLVTVATDETDGYHRFMKSATRFGFDVKVVGMGKEWRGGNVAKFAGGGHKINLLVDALSPYKDDGNLLIMFTDSYDVVLAGEPEEVISKFVEFKSKLVVSAEGFCWPDRSLANIYPKVTLGKRFLCSGGYIGYAPVIYEALTSSEVKDLDDDQLFFTNLYLDKDFKKKHNMRLDHRSHIFQNLHGAEEDVDVKFDSDSGKPYVENIVYGTRPLVLHGNAPKGKLRINQLGNYVPNQWNMKEGCLACEEDKIDLAGKSDSEHPEIFMSIFVVKPVPFFKPFLDRLDNLNYPESRLKIRFYCTAEYHLADVKTWADNHSGVTVEIDFKSEADARNHAINHCISTSCPYYFSLDADVVLTNRDVLKLLVEQNRSFLAPALTKHDKLWSNFWGGLSDDGFYARSDDYISIVKGERKGVWNVPYVAHVYLIKGSMLKANLPQFDDPELDADMSFCRLLREKGVFMFVTNQIPFGHLLEADEYETDHLHNDMYEVIRNPLDWEALYLHPNYSRNLNKSIEMEQPCPDVYYYPLMSRQFAKELVEELENFGQWSGGGHKDARLSGGYENVPTVDIHMNQISYEENWLHIIKKYVLPVQERVYPGYYSSGKAIMNFVVKYQPTGQDRLRPHHDSSTFTINIALSEAGKDYTGGGCRFLRYDCSIKEIPLGWSLMHPGRLTHWHEGLQTISGTRYIMVSFIDP